MIGASKHKRNKTIPTIVLVDCPACKKQRLGRYLKDDGTTDPVSEDTVDVRGETRFLDACEFCVAKYQRSDEKFIMENMKKLRKAFQATPDADDGESDHNDFSLNLD